MAVRQDSRKHRTLTEMNSMVRELSHDINANFMVLEDSFEHLKQQMTEHNPLPQLLEGTAHVEACLRESKRLLDDLVVLAKTGSVHMDPKRVELSTIVSEVVYEQADLLNNRSIVINVDPNLPCVWCNPQRLKQLITNLIRNAAIHGCSDGEPRLNVTATTSNHNQTLDSHEARIVVHDNGCGIPSKKRDEIFQPGARLPNSRPGGTGMGLAIVQRIAEYYGGKTFVDAECKSGTSIVVTLPLPP